MRTNRDSGETLVEIMLTIVIIGLTVTALLSSLATTGNAGNAQRAGVQIDVFLRNYAEATKAAVQGCVVATPTPTYTVAYQPPVGSGFTASGAGGACPSTGVTTQLTLRIVGQLGSDTMDIKVRTP